MTRSSVLWVSVRKDARALWPAFAACAAALAATALIDDRRFLMPGRFAYFIGSAAIAALSIGHEYTHGTLPLMLSLPTDRRRLLFGKLLVAVPMLGALAALTITLGSGGPFFERTTLLQSAAMLCAILLAPVLTMLCRSPFAGVVFAIGLTGQVFVLADLIGWARFGSDPSLAKEQFTRLIFGWSALALCAGAAAAGWRMFMRLEALDTRSPEMRLPRWLRGEATAARAATDARAPRSHPVWLIAKKELRLQQMSLAVSGLYVLIWIAMQILWRITTPRDPLAAVGMLHGGLLALLIGAIGSAQERQMGTLESQLLLPMAAWLQWTVKVAVMLGLALSLSFVLPVLLAAGEISINPWYAATIIGLTIGALYVSSLCGSTLKALAIAGPVMLIVLQFLASAILVEFGGPTLLVATFTSVVALALWFAFENHRSAGHELTRVGRQVLVMTGVFGLAALVARW